MNGLGAEEAGPVRNAEDIDHRVSARTERDLLRSGGASARGCGCGGAERVVWIWFRSLTVTLAWAEARSGPDEGTGSSGMGLSGHSAARRAVGFRAMVRAAG